MIKFGTDGWRAIIADEFTFANVRKVAKAIAFYLQAEKLTGKPLIVGYDARFLADKFAFEVAKVVEEAGIDVLLPNRDIPTPVAAWSIKYVKPSGACGAVMLTASHNPPQYGGIKFIPEYGGPADEVITRKLEENINKEIVLPSPKRRGRIDHFNPRDTYFEYLSSLIDFSVIKKSGLKVVCDPMFGSGRDYLDFILDRSGCQVEVIHNYRDVLFGGRNPEPDDENLEELKAKVIETGADLGLALDGDADRFGVVDETGKFYSANQVISLLFEYLVVDRSIGGSVVRSIGTTHMVDRIAERHKIKVYETPVGFKHVAKLMMEQDVIIGGEESGGLSIKGHIPEKDGILANLLVVEMLARRKKKLSQCWKELTQKVGEVFNQKINLQLGEEKKKILMDKLVKLSLVGGLKISKVNTLDGVKLILSDGSWVLARPSGTEPLVRVYAESDAWEKIEKIIDFVKSLI